MLLVVGRNRVKSVYGGGGAGSTQQWRREVPGLRLGFSLRRVVGCYGVGFVFLFGAFEVDCGHSR